MSEFNPNHTENCRCLSCRTQRLSHQAFPESTLNAGLFYVGTAAVTLADLTDDSREFLDGDHLSDAAPVKLKHRIPASALTVTLRNVSIFDDVTIAADDETPFRLAPQTSVELTRPDIFKHSLSATSENVAIAVSFTRLMNERSAS